MRENEELTRVLEAIEDARPPRRMGCGPHREDFAPELWDRLAAENRVEATPRCTSSDTRDGSDGASVVRSGSE